MIIEDQLGWRRPDSGVETFEEFDELPAAVAVSDDRMDLPGKQVEFRPTGSTACHDVCTRNEKLNTRLGRQMGAVVAMAWIPAFRRRKRSPLA